MEATEVRRKYLLEYLYRCCVSALFCHSKNDSFQCLHMNGFRGEAALIYYEQSGKRREGHLFLLVK